MAASWAATMKHASASSTDEPVNTCSFDRVEASQNSRMRFVKKGPFQAYIPQSSALAEPTIAAVAVSAANLPAAPVVTAI
jgi:hypothetical protein